ncbi:MAG: YabP/YqfC family sporulation protein [Oscillospiraceae bacterium]|nr:YabP/YqfC family sporulation protein [Oscillospiraceae bacterium]
MERRKRWASAEWSAMDRLDLPGGIAPDLPTVELSGNRQLYMAQHRGVLSYSTELVEINGGAVVIRVSGRGLQLLAMTDTELRIGGVITAVELVG